MEGHNKGIGVLKNAEIKSPCNVVGELKIEHWLCKVIVVMNISFKNID